MPSKLLPFASHLTAEEAADLVRRANARDAQATIGPLDPRTQSVPATREDPFAGRELAQSWMEDALDPGNWGGGEGALHAVSAPAVVAKGAELKSLMRKMVDRGAKVAEETASKGALVYPDVAVNTAPLRAPLNLEPASLTQFVQKRYPRTFGHVTDIGITTKPGDYGSQMEANMMDVLRAGITEDPEVAKQMAPKMSRLKFSHANAPNPAKGTTPPHEMLHVGDQISIKDFPKKYEATMRLPGAWVKTGEETVDPLGRKVVHERRATPYEVSSYELRAQNHGDSVLKDWQEFQQTDPRLPFNKRVRMATAWRRPVKTSGK